MEAPGQPAPGVPTAFSEYGTEPINTVVQGNWKLIYNPRGLSPVCIPDAPPDHYPIGRQELYDLSKDPGETTDLAAAHPEKVTELARLIRRRFAGLTDRVKSQRLPDDLKEELKSLGYVAH
jgi:arylsulfatase A-like enzyme